MAAYDDLLEDSEESLVFDADDEIAGFDPDDTESSVVIVEPSIIQIGRARRKDEMRRLQAIEGDDKRSTAGKVLPEPLPNMQNEADE